MLNSFLSGGIARAERETRHLVRGRYRGPAGQAAMDRSLNEHPERRVANGRLFSGMLKEYRRQASTFFPPIGTKRVTEIERRDIECLLEGLAPVMANRLPAALMVRVDRKLDSIDLFDAPTDLFMLKGARRYLLRQVS